MDLQLPLQSRFAAKVTLLGLLPPRPQRVAIALRDRSLERLECMDQFRHALVHAPPRQIQQRRQPNLNLNLQQPQQQQLLAPYTYHH